MQILLVIFFGILGVLGRYGVDRWLAPSSAGFPLNTFAINLTGCFVAGIIYALGERGVMSQALLTGLMVGLCGGFTTFSAYSLQSLDLLFKGKAFLSLSYLIGSPILGVLSAFVAVMLTRRLI
ncbi:MAG: hypothetical protein OM95_16420 [Bdellovibrio sp. ArHS]|uniref:fluoride efflux transporter FluC n=1 Tax=Bdellovibrio sp. ArHS TaxID=1569284 RepID=UPI000582939E|nr:CrcB family protein [Bdellovibrio sp. ArHS]KHD87094.1 MAG: hypothetical protein OM95_16420 [Bdellovibrio sp. ArHS]